MVTKYRFLKIDRHLTATDLPAVHRFLTALNHSINGATNFTANQRVPSICAKTCKNIKITKHDILHTCDCKSANVASWSFRVAASSCTRVALASLLRRITAACCLNGANLSSCGPAVANLRWTRCSISLFTTAICLDTRYIVK